MPFTPNLNLERPLNGSHVGTWDVPVNNNWDLLDGAFGGVTTVALSNVPIVLSAAQYANNFITFNGTLTGDVNVTFPAIGRFWMVQNNCVANTTFKITCWVSSAQQYVALPPNEPIAVMSDATNMKFVGFGRIGTYWDFGGSSVPIWVDGSNPQPYLVCDGTAFSSAIYPALRDYLGSATLPDARGRFRAALNSGTGRLTGTSALGGIDGNTLLANGGNQTIAAGNLPAHLHPFAGQLTVFTGFTQVQAPVGITNVLLGSGAVLSQTENNVGGGNAFAPPSYIGGITMIRAG